MTCRTTGSSFGVIVLRLASDSRRGIHAAHLRKVEKRARRQLTAEVRCPLSRIRGIERVHDHTGGIQSTPGAATLNSTRAITLTSAFGFCD